MERFLAGTAPADFIHIRKSLPGTEREEGILIPLLATAHDLPIHGF
jgi:hypothetical protein